MDQIEERNYVLGRWNVFDSDAFFSHKKRFLQETDKSSFIIVDIALRKNPTGWSQTKEL